MLSRGLGLVAPWGIPRRNPNHLLCTAVAKVLVLAADVPKAKGMKTFIQLRPGLEERPDGVGVLNISIPVCLFSSGS